MFMCPKFCGYCLTILVDGWVLIQRAGEHGINVIVVCPIFIDDVNLLLMGFYLENELCQASERCYLSDKVCF